MAELDVLGDGFGIFRLVGLLRFVRDRGGGDGVEFVKERRMRYGVGGIDLERLRLVHLVRESRFLGQGTLASTVHPQFMQSGTAYSPGGQVNLFHQSNGIRRGTSESLGSKLHLYHGKGPEEIIQGAIGVHEHSESSRSRAMRRERSCVGEKRLATLVKA